MINALIVEDEMLAAKRLMRLLEQCRHSVVVADTVDTVEDAVAFLKRPVPPPDLIFMDIHLADGSSFEIFEQVAVEVPIIFITAFEKYAIDAFKQESIDYLLKPIQLEELEASLDKYQRWMERKEPTVDYSLLIDAMRDQQKKRFAVSVGDRVRSVPVEQIALFYAENKATFLLTSDGKRYDVPYTLERLTQLLPEDDFFRVNRKCIVRHDNVVEASRYSASKLKLQLHHAPGFDVFVSGERSRDFKGWMGV